MAHHKRKRPKHRRSGCLLCKPQKLTPSAKGERRRLEQMSLQHERTADQDAEAIAAERIKSRASDHKEDGAEALERLGIEVPQRNTRRTTPRGLPPTRFLWHRGT
ncbi:MAG TPA: hypothetical protein VFU16_04970 [Solirubrobacterales bacterium]|nr:hypothetical protein [Solirubrobacterales bacterium]